MKKKERVLIRFRPEIYECFELEAAYEGLRVGTIANRLLISEIKKVARVGRGIALYPARKKIWRFQKEKNKTIMYCQQAEM